MTFLQLAIVLIISALLFYSIAVWSERFTKKLSWWHLVLFFLGFLADSSGTAYMGKLSGGFHFKPHTVSGFLALAIMFFHTIWATVVLVKKDQELIKSFHKYSLIAWLIWLIPFITGMLVSIPK